jgi:hypothetical protein
MNKNLKIVVFGFLVWLVPFEASFIIFPLKTSNRPLFESIMHIVLSIIVITLTYYYMKGMYSNYVKEGIMMVLCGISLI